MPNVPSIQQAKQGLSPAEMKNLGIKNTASMYWRGPIELYGMFVELTVKAFSDGSFSDVRWNKDPQLSGIHIAPDYIWDDVTVEKRPAIIVSLGDINCTQHQSFMNDSCVESSSQGEYGAIYKFCDSKSGIVSWNVIAETRGEALSLAGDLFKYLNVYQAPIRRDLCLSSFHVSGISPLSIVREARERLKGAVTAEFGYQDAWQLVQEGPKLKVADMRVAENLPPPIQSNE